MKLMIVESPNKVKTISQFLPKDYVCKASVGHITHIADDGLYNLGIDVKGDFKAKFVIDDGKKDIVKELKALVDKADEVILATDEDREGEAIAWHLKEELKIPVKKYKRVTFHEITKKAVLEALDNPRKIDDDLVDAAIGRSILDKIVGFRLSPIARRKVNARSVGRCQSVALKAVVEREEEITKFVPESFYELWLPFEKDKIEYKAQYKGLLGAKKFVTQLNNRAEADKVVEDCKNGKYIVNSIDSKDRAVAPKPPFITSTFQQEASNRFGYSIKRASQIAQSLFEGIDVGGVHKALISYIRTDDATLPDEVVDNVKSILVNKYDKDMFVGLRNKKKVKNAQEGHAGIYAVDLEMTPDKLANLINDQAMLKIYEMIYNRTFECCCKDAIITDTTYSIVNGKHLFQYIEHAVKEPGWKAISNYSDENDDEIVNKSIGLNKGDEIKPKI